MSACFDTSDVWELSRAALDEADRRLSEIAADLCAPFYFEAGNLEQQLLGVYRTVALCVRKEDDLGKIAAWWRAMTEACDEFAGRLAGLCQEHPQCGSEFFYNRVLDLRNKCRRLQETHA
jgi:predicted Zn-dependent protease with MMP-like domain